MALLHLCAQHLHSAHTQGLHAHARTHARTQTHTHTHTTLCYHCSRPKHRTSLPPAPLPPVHLALLLSQSTYLANAAPTTSALDVSWYNCCMQCHTASYTVTCTHRPLSLVCVSRTHQPRSLVCVSRTHQPRSMVCVSHAHTSHGQWSVCHTHTSYGHWSVCHAHTSYSHWSVCHAHTSHSHWSVCHAHTSRVSGLCWPLTSCILVLCSSQFVHQVIHARMEGSVMRPQTAAPVPLPMQGTLVTRVSLGWLCECTVHPARCPNWTKTYVSGIAFADVAV